MPNLPSLTIGKHTSRLPIVQGGMGVGISGHRLAGAVAREGGFGTLSAIGLPKTPSFEGRSFVSDPQSFYDESARCAAEEVRAAKKLADGGPVFINVMAAIHGYREQVRAAMEAGVDGIVTGAGVPPMELLELAKQYPDVALVPILSASKSVKTVLRSWWRDYRRLPDAIVMEDPSTAGGHLGANGRRLECVEEGETRTETVLCGAYGKDGKRIMSVFEIFQEFRKENIEKTAKDYLEKRKKGLIPEDASAQMADILRLNAMNIPVIAAGGIVDRADVDRALALGASGVQLGTRFLASEESAAHAKFKAAIVAAKSPEDLKTYQSSAMLPARAIASSPVFSRIQGRQADPTAFLGKGVENPARCAMSVNCLGHCALRDGQDKDDAGNPFAQMCILEELARVTEGGDGEGLYFTGTSALRIDTIKSVRQIMAELSGETA